MTYHDFILIWFFYYRIMAMSSSLFCSFYVIVYSWANHRLPWERMKESSRGLATLLHIHSTQSSRREPFLICQVTRSIPPLCIYNVTVLEQYFLNLTCMIHWETCYIADTSLVGLGEGPRFCISNRLSGDD